MSPYPVDIVPGSPLDSYFADNSPNLSSEYLKSRPSPAPIFLNCLIVVDEFPCLFIAYIFILLFGEREN